MTSYPISDLSGDALGIYYLSYMYYSALASSVVVIVGLLVSLVTGRLNPRKLDPRLIIPLGTKLGCCLPQSWREALNFHVGEEYVSNCCCRKLPSP